MKWNKNLNFIVKDIVGMVRCVLLNKYVDIRNVKDCNR